MAFGSRRLARGGNQDKIRLDHTLFRTRRQLQEILQHRILNGLFLRVGGLLERSVMRSKLEAFAIA
jgi:hypothetical protein